MTQDVQPLTWQKRTNLEEHQQFFSKINEIIDNLAPTVDEAEQAIAQANQAITDANAAIATANAASTAASAAAQQAQTAASTVAGYDTRLTAVEGEADANADNITALQGRMGTAEGNITSLGGRMTATETKNSQQDTAIAALQTADAQNVKISRINEYAVGLTDNQTAYGIKTFAQKVNGVANAYLTESSGNREAGTYQVVIKIPKAEIYTAGIRGHIFVCVGIRGGAGGLDVLDVSTNVRAPTGIKMCWGRGLNHNVTYVVSDDADYIYISRVNLGNSNDGVIGFVANTWGVNFVANIAPNTLITDTERASVGVAGTEVGRVNNI